MLRPVAALLVAAAALCAQPPLDGFQPAPWFGEHVREIRPADAMRAVINAPARLDSKRPTRIVVFATPNGNTADWTLGARKAPGLDWHYDIQHVGAQVRRLREVDPGVNRVLAVVEPTPLSWPAWRRARGGGGAGIRAIVDAIVRTVGIDGARITLAAHSGGGSFLHGFIEDGDAIPPAVDRIVFLDANYGFRDALHGAKLRDWLQAPPNRLVVIAYDDREIELKGRRVVGPTGGTWRATDRLFASLDRPLERDTVGPFERTLGFDDRFVAYRHPNPKNAILHTRLVGEMNGLLEGLAFGLRPRPDWGTFGGPRAYTAWIQPTPGSGWIATIPPRAADAPSGRAVLESVARATLAEREWRVVEAVARGNVPRFLREPATIRFTARDAEGKMRRVVLRVAADYFAVGGDRDFVRVPITPMTAQRLADRYGWSLPTRCIVDRCYEHAAIRIAPKPMTKEREAVATFLRHDARVRKQRGRRKPDALVVGAKKDVVVTPRARAGRVSIYGWHRKNGKPIQPLYTKHAKRYVDYSHGVRFVWRTLDVDGEATTVAAVLADPVLHPLLSDEGAIPIDAQRIPR